MSGTSTIFGAISCSAAAGANYPAGSTCCDFCDCCFDMCDDAVSDCPDYDEFSGCNASITITAKHHKWWGQYCCFMDDPCNNTCQSYTAQSDAGDACGSGPKTCYTSDWLISGTSTALSHQIRFPNADEMACGYSASTAMPSAICTDHPSSTCDCQTMRSTGYALLGQSTFTLTKEDWVKCDGSGVGGVGYFKKYIDVYWGRGCSGTTCLDVNGQDCDNYECVGEEADPVPASNSMCCSTTGDYCTGICRLTPKIVLQGGTWTFKPHIHFTDCVANCSDTVLNAHPTCLPHGCTGAHCGCGSYDDDGTCYSGQSLGNPPGLTSVTYIPNLGAWPGPGEGTVTRSFRFKTAMDHGFNATVFAGAGGYIEGMDMTVTAQFSACGET